MKLIRTLILITLTSQIISAIITTLSNNILFAISTWTVVFQTFILYIVSEK